MNNSTQHQQLVDAINSGQLTGPQRVRLAGLLSSIQLHADRNLPVDPSVEQSHKAACWESVEHYYRSLLNAEGVSTYTPAAERSDSELDDELQRLARRLQTIRDELARRLSVEAGE